MLTNNSEGRKEEVNVQDIGGGGEGERGTGGVASVVPDPGSSLSDWGAPGSVVAESGESREDAAKEEALEGRRS